MDTDPSQTPKGDETFVAGENEFAALGDDDADSSEGDKHLKKSGLDKFISSEDISAMRSKAAELAETLADELVHIRPGTPEYQKAKAEWLAMQNAAEGTSIYEGQADEAADMIVRANTPYEELARIKERELKGQQGAFERSLRTTSVANPELAEAELGLLRVALAAEKIRLAGAARESLPVDPSDALFYAEMITALEGYQRGDRSIGAKLRGGSEITAEEYMKGHIDQARRAEAEKVRLARERRAEQPVIEPESTVEQPAASVPTTAESAQPSAERTVESAAEPTTEPVPADEAGYKAYERKYFREFDPNRIDNMRLFVQEAISVLERQHAAANNPNIRYPDTVAGIMGNTLEGANTYLANLFNFRNGADGARVQDVREILPMKFSDFAKNYLDIDVEATDPNYSKVFRSS